jgi:cystathionine beta-lyase
VIDVLRDAVDHAVFGYPGGTAEGYVVAGGGCQAWRFGWEVPQACVI